MKVGIVSNSPGELIGWAIPACQILKKLKFSIDLYLTPCMFATNQEFKIALKYGNFDQIFTPYQTFKEIFLKKNTYDFFIHMGGEIWYSTKFKTSKLFSYAWGTKKLDRFFFKYLVPNQYYYRKLISRNINQNKIIKIKDLVFEKFKVFENNNFLYNPFSDVIGFMLGSRKVEFWGLLEIYLKTITLLDNKYNFVFFVSPFIYEIYKDLKEFEQEVINFANLLGLTNILKRVEFVFNDEQKYLWLKKIRLLVTIPGTKTNEAGYLGVPQLVILPLQKPEYIPLWGILGWLDFLGYPGKKIKGYFVLKYAQKNILTKKRFIAMPNIIANKEIVPEIAGVITHQTLAEFITKFQNDQLLKINQELKQIYQEWEKESISFEEFIISKLNQ